MDIQGFPKRDVPREVRLEKEKIVLTDEVEGFLEREIKPVGNSAKVNAPKRYIGRRAYLIITKEEKQSD